MYMKFQNPSNGYIEETKDQWVWALLFGPFYFLYKGIWVHFIMGLVLGFFTYGISILFYAYYAENLVYEHYMSKGWKNLTRK